MKFVSNTFWLAGFIGVTVGYIHSQHEAFATRPQQHSIMYASSHTFAQRRPTAASIMYATSHTLAERQVSASPVLVTSVSIGGSVTGGSSFVVPTSINSAYTPGKDLKSVSSIAVTDLLHIEAITTVTSFLEGSSMPQASTRATGSVVLISTTTVEELVTVTSMPLLATFLDPQSQVQGSTSGPPISFIPVSSTTANSAPTSTTKPKTDPSAGGYIYLGCYAEGLGVRALGDAFFPDDYNTIERCVIACYPYKYAGAEYGRECWCGNELKGVSKVSDSDFCNMACPGNQEEYCGGIVALNVYRVEEGVSASFVPVSVSGNSLATGSTSPAAATLSPSHTSQSHIVVSSITSSAAASTISASTSSITSSLKASSDSQVLTASLVSSQAATSRYSSTSRPVVQSTFVTSSQTVPVSVIIQHGTTMTTSVTTRTQISIIFTTGTALSNSSTTQASTALVYQSSSLPPGPSVLISTARIFVTISDKVQPVMISNNTVTISFGVTNLHTVTQKLVPSAISILSSSSSSSPTFSSKSRPTPILPPTITSAPSPVFPFSDHTIAFIPAFCPSTVSFIPSAIPTDHATTISQSWSGIWTTPPPAITFVEITTRSIMQPTPPRPQPTSSPSYPSAAGTTTASPGQSPQSPVYFTPVPIPQISSSKADIVPISSLSITSRKYFSCATTTHKYDTSSEQPSRSVVTVTSFLIPISRGPISGSSMARKMDFSASGLLVWLGLLIFVI